MCNGHITYPSNSSKQVLKYFMVAHFFKPYSVWIVKDCTETSSQCHLKILIS